MTNQVAIRAHTEPGHFVLFDQNAHVYLLEGGAPGGLSCFADCFLAFAAILQVEKSTPRRAILSSTIFGPVKLLCLENTHNIGGGSIWPLEQIQAVAATARRGSLFISTGLAFGTLPNWCLRKARYAAPFDTVSVCFSKALGAPVVSCLAGSKALITRARRFKLESVAASGKLASSLPEHFMRWTTIAAVLREMHSKAARFAGMISSHPEIDIDPATVETNIVRFGLRGISAGQFVEEAYRLGLHMLPSGPNAVRAVFYLDISLSDVERASELIGDALRNLERQEGDAEAKDGSVRPPITFSS